MYNDDHWFFIVFALNHGNKRTLHRLVFGHNSDSIEDDTVKNMAADYFNVTEDVIDILSIDLVRNEQTILG